MDSYLSGRWDETKKAILDEYTLICDMHRELVHLGDAQAMIDEELYAVKGLELPKPAASSSNGTDPMCAARGKTRAQAQP